MNKPREVFSPARRLACLFLALALTTVYGYCVTSVPVSQNQDTIYVAGKPAAVASGVVQYGDRPV